MAAKALEPDARRAPEPDDRPGRTLGAEAAQKAAMEVCIAGAGL